jgi:beta-lactam-binding protein with PASTA domain
MMQEDAQPTSVVPRPVARASVVALVPALAFMVSTSAMTGGAVADQAPALLQAPGLALEPTTGPPGTEVTAIASGYRNCPPTGNDDVGPGEVIFLWDGADKLAVVPVEDGSASATFVIPESASLAEHNVVTWCLGDDRLTAAAGFEVTRPMDVLVVVPNIVGMPVAQAQEQLGRVRLAVGQISGRGEVISGQDPLAGTEVPRDTAVDVVLGSVEPVLVVVPDLVNRPVDEVGPTLTTAGLRLGSVSGSGEVVRSQSPVAGAEVPRGTAVGITVGPSMPSLVTVPDLLGLDVDVVPGILASRGLELGQVAGTGEVVRSQNPAAGSQVPSGTAVSVSVEAAVPPPRLVAVPSLIKATVDEANAALTAAGLVLGNNPGGDGTVESQEPAAGTLVPAGSAVTVTLTQPTPWWPAAALAVLLGVALLATRMLPSHRDRRWVRAHVRATSGAPPGFDVDVTEQPAAASPPTHVVRIEPHPDSGTQVFEEVGR